MLFPKMLMTTNLTSIPHTYPANWLTHDDVHKALNGWHSGGLAHSGIDSLYLFQHARASSEDANRFADNDILRQALEQLAQSHAEFAEILQLRFLDNRKAERLANQLNLASSTFYDRQKSAIEQLTNILREMDQQTRTKRYTLLEQKLARQQKLHLVGLDDQVVSVSNQLNHGDFAWIVSIEGIGGIGKTTLAGEAVRHALWHDVSWENVAWITVRPVDFPPLAGNGAGIPGVLTVETLLEELYRQLISDAPPPDAMHGEQLLVALEQYLRHHKSLIVIDNLETVADIDALLPTLCRLMNPSKFVLTSRQSFYAKSEVYHVPLNELNEQDAIHLVRAEARGNNLMEVVTATDDELRPIFETVGGNPLALRLVVGQLHIFDLGQVLADLREARGQSAELLYIFIFRRAWDYLDETARRLFVAMLLTCNEGDTFDNLLAICEADLSRSELAAALKQLVMFNLVESRGGLLERRYTIHNLTRSFLHRQVKLWQEAA